jgi:glycosyltransferase involved in cell wall biosynthesis
MHINNSCARKGDTGMPNIYPAESHPQALQRKYFCVVTDTYPPEVNGVALTLARLVEGLKMLGHTVSVVRPRQWTGDRPACKRDPDVTLMRGVPLLWYKGLHVGLPASGLLHNRWRQHRPDVVYVATEGLLGWSAVRTAQHLGIPVLSGFHTNFHSYSKHDGLGWLQPLVALYLCWFHNRTASTLVPSLDLRDQLQILGRGVDSELFTPARRCQALQQSWGVGEHDVVVLLCGAGGPGKNIGLAIAAYGPQRATLQKGHPDLLFCGAHRAESLAKHYASANIFLFPSDTETFGNVTVEAMASGLAVIAYDYLPHAIAVPHPLRLFAVYPLVLGNDLSAKQEDNSAHLKAYQDDDGCCKRAVDHINQGELREIPNQQMAGDLP